jgi:hypothetical protein
VTHRRWWLLLLGIAGVEAGCLWGCWQLTRIDVPE